MAGALCPVSDALHGAITYLAHLFVKDRPAGSLFSWEWWRLIESFCPVGPLACAKYVNALYSDHHHQLILVVDDLAKGRSVSEGWMRELGI